MECLSRIRCLTKNFMSGISKQSCEVGTEVGGFPDLTDGEQEFRQAQ